MNDVLAELPDVELLARTRQLALDERRATARLIAGLAEVDARKLYLGEGCSSLFTYCTQVLHFSENAAYGRIAAARAAKRFPIIFPLLEGGSVNVTTVGLLAPHLTEENCRAVLDAARHKSKREVEHQMAALHPRPAIPSSVRKLPQVRPPMMPEEPSLAVTETVRQGNEQTNITPPSLKSRPLIAPLAPERYKVQFTVPRETYDKLRRVQDLLRHAIPSGDPAAIFDRALSVLLGNLEKRKLAATDRPRPARKKAPNSRNIPAAVRRAVWARDAGRCAFVGSNGRCAETGFLEFHHVVPFACGGVASLENIELRCRAHNQHEADVFFCPVVVRESSAGYVY